MYYFEILLDSAFRETRKTFEKGSSTSVLQDIINQNNITEIYFCGLAIEYGLQFNVLDCNMHTNHASIFCITDACKGFNIDDSKEIFKKFEYEKISLILSNSPELAVINEKDFSVNDNNEICCILSTKSSYKYEVSSSYISVDDRPWTDKRNKFTTIPTIIQKSYYIPSYQADRTNTSSNFLVIRLKCRSKIAILWPSHNKHPNWLIKSYSHTKTNVATDHPTVGFEVWMKDSETAVGEDLVFGGSEGILADNNSNTYLICIEECVPTIGDIVFAINHESDAIVKRLLNKIDESGDKNIVSEHFAPLDENLLHCAVKARRINVIGMLMNYEIGMNHQNLIGDTPLHIACRMNNNEIIKKILLYDISDLNIGSYSDGYTPIMIACELGNLEIISELLSNNQVKTVLQSKYKSNCLALAIHSDKELTRKIYDIIINKMKKNAKIFQHFINEDIRGWDCLFLTCKCGLFDITLTKEFREMYKEKKLINRKLKEGYNIIDIAAWNGQSNILSTVLKECQDDISLNTINEETGYSELDYAV